MTVPRNLLQCRRRRWRKMSTKNTTTTTEALAEGGRRVQGIRDDDRGDSSLTTGLVCWQRQRSVDFPCYRVANSNTVLSLSCCCLVLIFFIRFPFFPFAARNNISTASMRKMFFRQVYTNLACVPPMYRRVKKLQFLMINKDVCNSLARKN